MPLNPENTRYAENSLDTIDDATELLCRIYTDATELSHSRHRVQAVIDLLAAAKLELSTVLLPDITPSA